MAPGARPPRRSRPGQVAAGLVVALAAAACGGSTGTTSDLSGSIFVSGSSTVEPITALVAEGFQRRHGRVALKVDGPGTGDGFQLFCRGETDISDASRPIKPAEVDQCRAAGVEFIELKVAIDGISIVTSRKNRIDCLSYPELYALLGPESQGFRRWSDANALVKAVGGSGDFPDLPLVVTAPGEESGTFDSFAEIVLAPAAKARGKEAVPRKDYQASPNDNVIIDGVAGSTGSLGWVGYSFAQASADRVKLLAVEKKEGGGCVAPTADAIADGSYPVARPLLVYVNAGKLATNPALEPFVDFYLSDEGYQWATEAGYVPLDARALAATRAVWAAKRTGAHAEA